MVASCWQHNHITLLHPDPDPTILWVTDVEVATTTQAVTNLLVCVYMLLKEILYFRLVAR